MTGSSRNRNVLLVVGTAVACAMVVFTIGVASPRPISNPMLGSEWQCHRSAGILTTCKHLTHAAPLTHRARPLAADFRRV
jgi:hypothetical protein